MRMGTNSAHAIGLVLNQIRTLRLPVQNNDSGATFTGTIGANGFPTSLTGGNPTDPGWEGKGRAVIDGLQEMHRYESDRTYKLTWEGTGVLGMQRLGAMTFDGPAQATPVNERHYEVTTDPGNPVLVWYSMSDADPIRNIKLVRTDHEALLNAGQFWTPEMIAWQSRFSGPIRPLDLMYVNANHQTTTAQYLDMSERTWWVGTSPVPLPAIIDLCNRTNRDFWLPFSMKLPTSEHAALATYVKNNLNSNLKVRIEGGNEIWNGIFAVHQYLTEEGDARLGMRETPIGYSAYVEHGWRTANAAQVWRTVFADQPTRLRVVMGTQTVTQGVAASFKGGVESVVGAGNMGTLFDDVAITGYHMNSVDDPLNFAEFERWADLELASPGAGVAEAILIARTGKNSNGDTIFGGAGSLVNVASDVAGWNTWIAANGMKELTAYETNIHYSLTTMTQGTPQEVKIIAFVNAMLLTPAWQAHMTDMLNVLANAGVTDCCFYKDFGSGGRSGWWQMQYSPFNADTPTTNAVVLADGGTVTPPAPAATSYGPFTITVTDSLGETEPLGPFNIEVEG